MLIQTEKNAVLVLLAHTLLDQWTHASNAPQATQRPTRQMKLLQNLDEARNCARAVTRAAMRLYCHGNATTVQVRYFCISWQHDSRL